MLPTAFVLLRTLVRSFYLTLFLLLSVQFVAVGLTYYTLSNGDWNSTAVWSTNSVTGCSCVPSDQINGFNVVIRHSINITSDIHIKSGNVLTININSGLSGGFNISVDSGELNSSGTISNESMTVKASGIATFSGPVTSANNFMVDGAVTIASAVTVTDANFIIKPGGTLLLTPGSNINLLDGNLKNNGTITFDSACVAMNSGNFENLAGGTISGTGSINVQSGNIANEQSWNLGVDWCASGSGTGMPMAEKCVSGNCALGTPLPIDLVFFRGHWKDGKVSLTWQTAIESNNEYFIIERVISSNRDERPISWEEIEVMPGAGNSNTIRNYSLVDDPAALAAQSLTVYYRLKQTDYDGKYEYSDAIAINVSMDVKFSIHPNPSPGKLTIEMYVNEPQIMHFSVYDLWGNRIYEETLERSRGNMQRQIDLSGHSKGIYKVQLTASTGGTVNKTIILQ